MMCPRCDASLPHGSRSCDCGWKDRVNKFNPEAGRYVERKCARETCYIPAMPGHTLCEYHYVEPHQKAAIDKCEALGLKTVPEMRAWLKANAGSTFRRFGANGIEPSDREPGQDDEWREDYRERSA